MKLCLIILTSVIAVVLIGVIVMMVVVMRWMKRRDAAQAELLKRMLERHHELEVLREELRKRDGE